MNFCGRFLFAIVWVGVFFAFSLWAWRHRFGTPLGMLVILAIFDLIALAVIWDIVLRLQRTLQHRVPVVEIDHDRLAYGDSAQLRVVEEHPESINEMGVKLIGECYNKADQDISEHRQTVISLTRVYEEELMRIKPASAEPISRVVQLHLPKSPPAGKVQWKIIVDSHLKHGGITEHPFPIRVRDFT